MTNPTNPTPPSPEALQQALQTISALLATQPHQAAEQSLLVESATKVDALDEQIKLLGEQKRVQVSILLPLLHKLSGGKLVLSNMHEILACLSHDKRVAKKQIVEFFGKEKAEEFWKTVPSKTREYVSVKRPGEKAEENEDAPVPAATEVES